MQMSDKTQRLTVYYAAALAAIYTLTGLFIAVNQESVVRAALNFVLPESWLPVAEMVAGDLIENHMGVFVGLTAMLAISLATKLTFPLREAVSASFEVDLQQRNPMWAKPKETPLLVQAWEEGLLFLFETAISVTTLRMALTPGWSTLGTVLSMVLVPLVFAVNFIGPTLARHHIGPMAIYRVLLFRYPVQSILYGAIFTVAPQLMAWMLQKAPTGTSYAILAVINVAAIIAATLGGTRAGTQMASETYEAKTAKIGPAGGLIWLGVVLLIGINGTFLASLGSALYHITPTLKCEWEMVEDTFNLKAPTLRDPTVRASFDVEVTNPTDRLAKVGDNEITLAFQKDVLASTHIPEFEVQAGEKVRQHIDLDFKVRTGAVSTVFRAFKHGLDGVLDKSNYQVTLVLPTPTGRFTYPLL